MCPIYKKLLYNPGLMIVRFESYDFTEVLYVSGDCCGHHVGERGNMVPHDIKETWKDLDISDFAKIGIHFTRYEMGI